MPLPSSKISVLAAAGSRKTEYIIDSALAVTNGRVLITTYTLENQRNIIARIQARVGMIPANITVVGWFSFLLSQCARPYQRAFTGKPLVISGLNFEGQKSRFARKTELRYFLDNNNDVYRDGLSDLVVELNRRTSGAVVARLEKIYSHIFVDEVQDLVGFDLDVLELLLPSTISLVMVGDPRQHTYSTNRAPRNKRYRGEGLFNWFRERSSRCEIQERLENFRSNQAICDFADSLYPLLPASRSVGVPTTGHDGLYCLPPNELSRYLSQFPTVVGLRYSQATKTHGVSAMNIGTSKGLTFDRALIFPTKPMIQYLSTRDLSHLSSKEKLYVAVTRARYSVAFVLPPALVSQVQRHGDIRVPVLGEAEA